ncbi:MAG: VOC family protein, partial [Acidimicrobiales bacterium]
GFDGSDHVLELLEYPGSASDVRPRRLTDRGISHVGMLCDDIDATRSELEGRDVRFLTSGVAGIAGLSTMWFEDPYGNVFILMEKGSAQDPYWRQPRRSTDS